uniref:Uncharacterized protein n=1 Tax=viral metagenome TaxID=1070528 RepID=A0A6M3KYJ9_9ZZZZ
MDLELFRCAQINFNNVEKLVPLLKEYPIFQIAKTQLAEAIEVAEKEEDE